MALEPAGISLEAQGFQDYIRKLDQIDKKNREVFDAQFKGTDKSFKEVTAAAKKYEQQLKKTAQAERAAAQEAKKLAAANAVTLSGTLALGAGVLVVGKQIATAAFELGKLGAQFEGQETGLNNLAASYGQSGADIRAAIQRASSGTVSELQAIQAANQALLLGVAKTPAEFETLTKSALTLGRTLGLTAEQSLEQFTTALGRQSKEILDNFGISASAVNAEIEKLGQAKFGLARSELSEAQKSAVFMEAALKLAGEAAETIGDNSDSAAAAFGRLEASAANFQTELGLAIADLNKSLGITDIITREINKASEALKVFRGGTEGATIDQQIEATELKIRNLNKTLENTRASQAGTSGRLDLSKLLGGGILELVGIDLDQIAIEKQQKSLADLNTQLNQLKLDKAGQDTKTFNDESEATAPILEDNTKAIKAYQAALSQAENLQLSFARSAEDEAIKQARAIEDIAQKQSRQVASLDARQQKNRDKLLQRQQKDLAKFEKTRASQIGKAEQEVAKERRKAADERIRLQKQLQDRLQQQEARFRLNQLQGERRFGLQERRLRAQGDILALQQLREDRDLQVQEEKENFELSQKETSKSGKEQLKQQEKTSSDRLGDLKASLDTQRAELLATFDEQVVDLEAAQEAERAALQASFALQAQDRQISLQREEEDRRLSQQRQLEDLGRSFADQEAITGEGAAKVADQLENVFGIDGAADTIMSGFTARTEGEFVKLFEDIDDIVSSSAPSSVRQTSALLPPPLPTSISQGGIPRFNEGGVVPGPVGQPRLAVVEGGETVLPTHKRSVSIAAPVVPSQTLNVQMAGGFNITGGDGVGDAAKEAAIMEMTEAVEIAVLRMARRN